MSERYAFIAAEKACSGFPVRRGCKLLEVSTSGFYAWRDRPVSSTSTRRAEIGELAAKAHAASEGSFGYRRVHRDLVEAGVACSWQLVRRAMREQGLAGVQPAAFRVTTRQDPDAKAAPLSVPIIAFVGTPGASSCWSVPRELAWRSSVRRCLHPLLFAMGFAAPLPRCHRRAVRLEHPAVVTMRRRCATRRAGTRG